MATGWQSLRAPEVHCLRLDNLGGEGAHKPDITSKLGPAPMSYPFSYVPLGSATVCKVQSQLLTQSGHGHLLSVSIL